jgi:hypothetical protein
MTEMDIAVSWNALKTVCMDTEPRTLNVLQVAVARFAFGLIIMTTRQEGTNDFQGVLKCAAQIDTCLTHIASMDVSVENFGKLIHDGNSCMAPIFFDLFNDGVCIKQSMHNTTTYVVGMGRACVVSFTTTTDFVPIEGVDYPDLEEGYERVSLHISMQ